MSANLDRAYQFAKDNILRLCSEVSSYQQDRKLPTDSMLRQLAELLRVSSLDYAVAENLVAMVAVRYLAELDRKSFCSD